jgi:hypothetical protein
MERLFQEEEVLQALLSMDGDKAPSPNGFTIAFFRSCWAVVKDDLMRIFHNFHEHELFEKSLNTTFIALIPKKIVQLEVRDCRPIDLMGSVFFLYK